MSLTSTYVKRADGQYYKDPVWSGTYQDRFYFVCVDDEDPPELVVAGGSLDDVVDAVKFLRQVVTKFKLSRRGVSHALRCFPQTGWDFAKMTHAASWFFEFEEAPPAPTTPTRPTPFDAIGTGGIYSWDGCP